MLPKGDVVICSVGHYCRCDTSGGHYDKCDTSGVRINQMFLCFGVVCKPYNVYLQVQIQTYKRK